MDLVSADSKDIDHAIQGVPSTCIQSWLEATGIVVSRYGLVVVLLLIGALKFTPGEAAGIQPLVAHSPLMSWLYGLLRGSRGFQRHRHNLDSHRRSHGASSALPEGLVCGQLGSGRNLPAHRQLPILNA